MTGFAESGGRGERLITTGVGSDEPGAPLDGSSLLPVTLTLLALAALAAVVSILFQRPVLATEPVFVVMNAAVTVTMVTLGAELVLRQGERFTGWSFVIAGFSWLLVAADVYPGWGGWIAFVFGAGAPFYTPISWGVLRYGRRALGHRSERLFILACAVVTSGFSAVQSLFSEPTWEKLPGHDSWPALWPDHRVSQISQAVLSVGFVVLALYFVLVLRRVYSEAPPTRRIAIRPLYIFGAAMAVGSSVIYTMADLSIRQFSVHRLAIFIAVFAVVVTIGLGVAIASQQSLVARLVEQLPVLRTSENVAHYVRTMLRDDSAELLFWESDSERLIDIDGRARELARELRDVRYHQWITGGDGQRVALLTAHPLLRNDSALLGSLSRVVSILAENARLHAVLRMQVTQLTAAKTAQQMAFDHAREQFHRDLHDGLQQTIAAARMDLEGVVEAENADDRNHMTRRLADRLGLALDQVRSLKKGTRPPDLRFGLKAAIERAIADLRLTTRCHVASADLGILTVPVYYVIREALTNVHKHARAALVEVEVTTDGRTIDIVVRDDGVGGAPDHYHGGIGGMKRRVEELGGEVHINSQESAGTTMRASLPCVS